MHCVHRILYSRVLEGSGWVTGFILPPIMLLQFQSLALLPKHHSSQLTGALLQLILGTSGTNGAFVCPSQTKLVSHDCLVSPLNFLFSRALELLSDDPLLRQLQEYCKGKHLLPKFPFL